jgi:hypothetical protein
MEYKTSLYMEYKSVSAIISLSKYYYDILNINIR